MGNITKKQLLKSQQGEIDAVLVYQKLADRVAKNHPAIHETLMKIGSDEGRHANMLRKITGETLKPKATLSNIVYCLTYLIGKKRTLQFLAKTEHKALETYKPFAAEYPELETMRLDEGRHGDLLDGIVKELFS